MPNRLPFHRSDWLVVRIKDRAGEKVWREYRDQTYGEMQANESGKPFIGAVTLRPKVDWSGEREPSSDEASQLHRRAHGEYFIVNFVITEKLCHNLKSDSSHR